MASLSNANFCLREICNVLEPVKDKWAKIGIQLGIPNHKLKEFKKEDDPLTETIDYWLKGNVKDFARCWQSLVTVLESPQVSELGLATTVRSKQIAEGASSTQQENITEEDKDFAKLPPDVHKDLTFILECNRNEICSKYARFVARICQSVKKCVTAKDLHSHLLNIPALTSSTGGQCQLISSEDLKSKTTVNEIFDFISTSSADFLHYDIFAEIVESYGSNTDHELLKQYSKSVKEYVNKHTIAEFMEINPNLKEVKNTKKALFKIDMNLLPLKLSKIDELEKVFAQILGIKPSALRFYSVEEGCVMLTFLVPESVANEIFRKDKKLAKKQISDFQALSVKWIECGEFTFDFDIKTQVSHAMSLQLQKQNVSKSSSVLNPTPSRAKIQAEFPYLKTENLSSEEKHQLIGRLEYESKNMKKKFITLVAETCKSLNDRNVRPDDVLVILKGFGIPRLSETETSVSTAMSKVYEGCTFFNYAIIETIINVYGNHSDKERLSSYEENFKEYCKRRICEVPLDVLKSDLKAKVPLHVKTDKNFDVPADDIHSIGIELSKLLDTTLLLLHVKDGCVQFDFNCLKSQCFLPLQGNNHIETFKRLGITKIFTSNQVFYEQQQHYEVSRDLIKTPCEKLNKECDKYLLEDIPEFDTFNSPLYLCERGDFEALFNFFDKCKKRNLKIHGCCPDSVYQINQPSAYKPLKPQPVSTKQGISYYSKSSNYKHNFKVKEPCINCQPIHFAAAHGNVSAMQTLVGKYNCSPDSEFNPGSEFKESITPLHVACYYGHCEIVKYLLEECKCDIDERKLQSAFSLALKKVIETEPNGHVEDHQINLIRGASGTHYLKIALLLVSQSISFKRDYFKYYYNILLNFIMMCGELNDLNCLAESLKLNLKHLFSESTNMYSLISYSFSKRNFKLIEKILFEDILPTNSGVILYADKHHVCEKISSLIIDKCVQDPMFTKLCIREPFESLMEYVIHHYRTANMTFLIKGIVKKFSRSVDSQGRNLLHYACKFSMFELAEILLNDNPHLQKEANENMQLPLHTACMRHYDLVEKQIEMIDLVSSNCDINSQDKDGNTPLHLVYYEVFHLPRLPILEHLIKKRGCSITIKNKAGWMLIERLLYHFKSLVDDDDVAFSSLEGINQLNDDGDTLLHIACEVGRLSLAKYLVTSLGAAIDIPNMKGNLPLHIVSNQILRNDVNPEELNFLINSRVIDKSNTKKDTALHIVCSHVCRDFSQQKIVPVVKYFINTCKANVNIPDEKERLPLHYIASARYYHSAPIEKLLDLVCTNLNNVNAKDKDGNTALHFACGCEDLYHTFDEKIALYLLQKKNASVDICSDKGYIPLHYLFLNLFRLERVNFFNNPSFIHENIKTQDGNGNTLLHLTCYFSDMITWILSVQSSLLKVKNNEGMIPLHCCLKNHLSDMLILKSLTFDDGLLMQDKDGNIPLHYASGNVFDYRPFLFLIASNFPVFTSKIKPQKFRGFRQHREHQDYIELPSFSTLKLRENAFDMICMKNNKGCSPLQLLIDEENLDMLAYIIELFSLQQERYNFMASNGLLLHKLVHERTYNLLKCLINASNVFCLNSKNESILHIIAQHTGSMEIIDAVPLDAVDINARNTDGDTPLHLACRLGERKLVQLFLQHECVSNLQNEKGDLPLHDLCGQNRVFPKGDYTFEIFTFGSDEMLQILPIRDVDICTFNKAGLAPIHIACQNCRLETIKYLHHKCKTCLNLPHCYDGKQTAKLPIEFIFDFHDKYATYKIPNPLLSIPELIHYLVRHTLSNTLISNQLKLFINHLSCNVHFKETEKYLTEEDPLFSFTCSINYPLFKEMNSFKFLCRAAWYGRIDIMKYLIYEENCDPRDVDNEGNDALAYACHLLKYYSMPHSQFFPVNFEFSCSAVKFLVDCGCSPIEDRYNRTDIFAKVCDKKDILLFTAIMSDSIELRKLAIKRIMRSFTSDFIIEAFKFLIKSFKSDQVVNDLGETPIHLSCYHHSLVDILEDYELTSSTLRTTNIDGNTPLDIACINGNLSIVKHLFEKNHVSAEDLILSVSLGNRHSQLVAYLLKNIPLIDILKQRDKIPYAFLKQVVCKGYKFDVNDQANYNSVLDNQDNNMLHFACQFDALRIVRHLKKNSTFNTLARNNEGDTPLHIACKHLAFKCVKELGSSAIDEKNRLGNTPLHIACQNASVALVRHLNHGDLSVQNDDGDTPVHIACREGCFSVVHYLKEHHQHIQKAISLQNIAKQLPLGIALKNFSKWKITLLRLKSLYDLINMSIKEQVIEYEDASLLSFLCQREEHHYVEIVQQLVNYGVRLDIRDDKEKLPLHYAAATSLNMLKLCVSPEIDVNSKDMTGNTPLHIACVHEKHDIVKCLLEEMECDCNVKNTEGKTPLHVACCKNSVHSISILLPHVKQFCPDYDGNFPLHLLCKTFTDEKLTVFAKIIEILRDVNQADTISIRNGQKELPHDFLCLSKHSKALQGLKKLWLFLTPSVEMQNTEGNTPLHLACLAGRHDIIQYLISLNIQIWYSTKNKDSALPLHIVSALPLSTSEYSVGCNMDETEKLIYEEAQLFRSSFLSLVNKSNINATDGEGNTPLHILLRNETTYRNKRVFDIFLELMDILIHTKNASLDISNAKGEYSIHIACQYHNLEVIQLLEFANALKCTNNGNTVFHLAIDFPEIIEYFRKEVGDSHLHKPNNNGDTPLHTLCRQHCSYGDLKPYQMILGDIDCQNKEDNTPLHLALMAGNYNLIKTLIDLGCDVTLPNKNNETPLDLMSKTYSEYAEHVILASLKDKTKLQHILSCANEDFISLLFLSRNKIIDQLLNLGIDPTPLYKKYSKFLQDNPTTPVSIHFIGDPMTGKTTLVNSLKREAGLTTTNQFHQDPQQTAGIIPTSYQSKSYGEVSVYDFAGQEEYHASHEMIMSAIIKKYSPPIVLLHVNITKHDEEILNSVLKWNTYTKKYLKSLSQKAHLILICSHADELTAEKDESAEKDPINIRISEVLNKIEYEGTVFELQDAVGMDCRECEGKPMQKLVELLTTSSKALRQEGKFSLQARHFNVFLRELSQKKNAIKISDLIHLAKKSPVKYNVPSSFRSLFDMCVELESNGFLMLLKNPTLSQSWVILNKEMLLHEITGTLFAPPDFPEYKLTSTEDEKLFLSETGIVPFSKVRSVFPSYDPNMVFAFLINMEYCYEVDEKVLSRVFKVTKNGGKYYFFPTLVKSSKPTIQWNTGGIQFGWIMKFKCDSDFFTPRFTQLFLLRLSKTLTKSPEFSKVWENCLYWHDNGIEAIAEVAYQNRKIIVSMCCEPNNVLPLLKHRSFLLNTIRKLRDEVYPSTLTAEYLVPSSVVVDLVNSPNTEDYEVESLVEICDDHSSHVTSASEGKLIVFDPYYHLCECLTDYMATEDNDEVTDLFLDALADHLINAFSDYDQVRSIFIKLLDVSEMSLSEYLRDAPQGQTHELVRIFQCWRTKSSFNIMGKLKALFDSISMFSGSTHIPAVASGERKFCTALAK